MRVRVDELRLELGIEGDDGGNIEGEDTSSESGSSEGLKDGKKW